MKLWQFDINMLYYTQKYTEPPEFTGSGKEVAQCII